MTDENIFQIFQKNFRDCLEREPGRKDLFQRCTRALVNAKTDRTKLLILFGQVILNKSFEYNKEVILNDDITKSVIKLINEESDKEFIKKLVNLSKTIDFFYNIAKLYVDLFSNENKLHEIFTSLLFKTKYDKDENDYVNSIRICLTNNIIEKFKYEEILSYIDKNYDNNKNFQDEYIKLFLQNDSKYINELNAMHQKSRDYNKSKLEKIIKPKTDTIKNDLKENNPIINIHKVENKNKCINNNESSQSNTNVNNSEKKDIKEIKIKKENIIPIPNKSEQKEKEKNNKNDTTFTSNEKKEKPEGIIPNLRNIKENKNIENNNYNNNLKLKELNGADNNNSEINSNKADDSITDNQNKRAKNIENSENRSEEKNSKEESTDVTNKMLKDNLNTVRDYLKEKLNEYTTNRYTPLSLDYILKNNISFSESDVSYVRLLNHKNVEFNPDKKLNDKILANLLIKLDLMKSIPDTQQYGYFCYNDGNKTIEALYSIIDSSILYDDITRVNKAENFYKIEENIRNEYLKSRAKSLEYFINKTVFEKKYENKPFPRIIFPLQRVFENYKFNDESFKNEIELDGCFFIEKNFNLDNNEFPFESQYFKPYIYNLGNKEIKDKDAYEFLPNDLCLIEIKTHFPSNNKRELYDNPKEKDFKQIINDFLDKMIVFEQLISDMNLKYNRIRLIIFYDVVKKYNYNKELENILTKYKLKEKCPNYYKKIYVQIIYMNANYFAASLKRFEDTIDIVNTKYDEVLKKLDIEKNKNTDLNGKYEELRKSLNNEINQNVELNGKYEELQKSLDNEINQKVALNKKYEEVKKNLDLQNELLKLIAEQMDAETKKKN